MVGVLENRAAGFDFHGGDAPRVEHHESLAMSTSQDPRWVGQRGDDPVNDLVFAARIPILVCDIQVGTTDEPDTKHDRFHFPNSRRSSHLPLIG